MMAMMNINYLVTGDAPGRAGNAHQNIVPYQVFACADGHLILAVGNDGQFAKFCDVAGTPEWARDPRFATNAERVRNRDALVPLIAAVMRTRTQRAWLDALEAARRSVRADQPARPGVRRSAGRRRAACGSTCRIRSRAPCRRCARRCAFRRTPLASAAAAAAARRAHGATCCASGSGSTTRRIARSRRARRDRRAAPMRATRMRRPTSRMTGVTRTAFWIAYAIAALLALVVAWRLFPLAIPIVNLDITMSRDEAIATARDARDAAARSRPTARARAARFAHDATTQNYVELEGGGKAAFAALSRATVYAPYWWEVRLFTPGAIDEAIIRFKPDGTP